jgi:hypothetical protein
VLVVEPRRDRSHGCDVRDGSESTPMMQCRNVLILSGLLMVVLMMSGCNIVGPASYILSGPPTVDAEYQLQDRPTVVFIDDRENMVNPVMLRRVIADRVTDDLMSRKLITQAIRPTDAMGVAARRDTRSEVMPIDAIGREVGAEQVIYIEMVSFTDHLDDQTPRGMAVCKVRVIDVENRRRLYPSDEHEQPYRLIQVMTREVSPDMYRSRATRIQVYEMLANETGSTVAKLFYKHEPRELGSRLGGR